MQTTRNGAGSQAGAKTSQFQGFEYPRENWSKLPHALIDALPLFSSKAELAVVLYVLRWTWGCHDAYKRITLDEFENGRRRSDGSRLDGGVGMGRQAIIDGIRRAIAHGFLRVETDATDGGRVRKFFSLNLNDLPEIR